jgi:hypothetical protein
MYKKVKMRDQAGIKRAVIGKNKGILYYFDSILNAFLIISLKKE